MISEKPAGTDRTTVVPLTYFAYGGLVVGLIIVLTAIQRFQLGIYGWMFTRQLLAIGIASLVYVLTMFVDPGWGSRAVNALEEQLEALSRAGTIPASASRSFTRLRAALRVATSPLVVETARDGPESPVRFAMLPRRVLGTFFRWFGALFLVATAVGILWADHRRFEIFIALLEAALALSVLPAYGRGARFAFAAVLIVSWGFASGLSFTHFTDLLVNAGTRGPFGVIAFVAGSLLTLTEIAPATATARRAVRWKRVAIFVGAALVFALLALRVDHLTYEWVPIHRSYFADVAQFVRDGHWLLFDVPSLYGFLSILTIALVPASDAWQGLYELTAFFLTVQSCITFAILRWGKTGWRNALFAFCVSIAMFGESISRYPWSSRLYPQGGMRYFWLVNLLFIAFLAYVWQRDERRLRILRWCGHAVWLCAVLWSLDNGLWCTVIWVTYLALDAFRIPLERYCARAVATRLGLQLWPLAALLTAAGIVLEVYYRAVLGSPPDLRAFAEFTGLFTSGKIKAIFHVQDTGAAWTLVLVVIACGTLAAVTARERRWPLFRLCAVCFATTWVVSTYYAVEPLDLYVTLLLGALVPVVAILLFVTRPEHLSGLSAQLARFSLAAPLVVALTATFAQPADFSGFPIPFTATWRFDATAEMPPLHGELADLLTQAGIAPGDRVIFAEGSYWTELSQGLVLPYALDADGDVVPYHAWLPLSPSAPRLLYNALPAARKRLYVERFLAQSGSGGWYIAFHQPANCALLSPRLYTARTLNSLNFSASLCQLGAELIAP